MSKKHPLSYPAPHPTKRTFNPLKSVPKLLPMNVFDITFGSDAMSGWFKKISVHGLLPLVLGAILALTGTKAMPIRSIAVLVCALWLSLTIGVEIAERKWSQHRKIIWFCVSTCLCFCMAMGVMWVFLKATIDDQQDDTARNLSIRMESAADPMNSLVIWQNNGAATILKNHKVGCFVNMITAESHSAATGVNLSMTQLFASEMKTGETESSPCLEGFAKFLTFGAPIKCIDITTTVIYSIEYEPLVEKSKRTRWVASKDRNFAWYGEPVKASSSYCPSP